MCLATMNHESHSSTTHPNGGYCDPSCPIMYKSEHPLTQACLLIHLCFFNKQNSTNDIFFGQGPDEIQ